MDPSDIGAKLSSQLSFYNLFSSIEVRQFDVIRQVRVHRGCRRMRKSLWRNMFKLQFYRVSMPNGPSWDTTPDYDPAPFADLGGSSGDQERWGAIWRWMRGETPIATPIMSGGVAAQAAVIIGSRRDVERVNAGYSLGNAAAAGSVEAVSTLLEPTP